MGWGSGAAEATPGPKYELCLLVEAKRDGSARPIPCGRAVVDQSSTAGGEEPTRKTASRRRRRRRVRVVEERQSAQGLCQDLARSTGWRRSRQRRSNNDTPQRATRLVTAVIGSGSAGEQNCAGSTASRQEPLLESPAARPRSSCSSARTI